jgi:aspartate 1-decarboxylase
MLRKVLLSKLHRGKISGCDINYEGSIAIDEALIKETGIRPYVEVEIYNINNGARFSTYVIPGGQGEIAVNGAAARLVECNDRVIICNYGYLTDEELRAHKPIIILLDDKNEIIRNPKVV